MPVPETIPYNPRRFSRAAQRLLSGVYKRNNSAHAYDEAAHNNDIQQAAEWVLTIVGRVHADRELKASLRELLG